MTTDSVSDEMRMTNFEIWFARNHPFDWFAKERGGEPLPHKDRILVWDLCRRAFLAGESHDA